MTGNMVQQSPATLIEMFRHMLTARELDQRIGILVRQGKGHFHLSCQGHEAVVGSVYALEPGKDFFFPYYRDLTVVLALGMSPREVFLNFFSRAADPCSGGRQMPMHWGSRRLQVVTASSVVANQLCQAVGVALAQQLQGTDAVTIIHHGEGATSKGDFHEALNFASVFRLPVIFLCENNKYATSVPAERQMAVSSVVERAPAYGMSGVRVDGTDPVAVYQVVAAAAVRARHGEGPALIEAEVVRLESHSSGDDQRGYRSAEELAGVRARDPVPRFAARLRESGLMTVAAAEALQEEVRRTIDQAQDEAEASPLPDPRSLGDHVYAGGRGANGRHHAN